MNQQHEKRCDLHRRRDGRWRSQFVRAAKAVRNVLAEWWGRDRIRIAPTAGRLLGLRQGDRILLRDRLFYVQRTCSCLQTDVFFCWVISEDERAILKTKRGEFGEATDSWLEVGGRVEAVFDDDVVVLAKRTDV